METQGIKRSIADANKITITPEGYGHLSFIKRNRPVKPKHVKVMKASVELHGCFRDVLVVYDEVDNVYVIVDGQHLAKSLMELGRDIKCHIIDSESELTKLMIDLNTTSKSWSVDNYIHAWAESGLKEYKELRDILKDNVNLQSTIIFMAYLRSGSRMVATNTVKEGSFKIANRANGDLILSQVKDCNKLLQSSRVVNQVIVQLILSVENYDHARMLRALKHRGKTLVMGATENEIRKHIFKIYGL